MAKPKLARTITALLPIILLLSALVWVFMKSEITEIFPKESDDVLYNPLMGFAPRADYYDLVQENTLVYVDVAWNQLEPIKGQFDFAAIETANYLEEWRVKGKRVVFRFICDIPGDESHMDIPQWLYDETGKDGIWYDIEYGKGYAPNYNNPVFIERNKQAIEALGRKYGQDDFFCYIELGSLGHWGEWHIKYDEGIGRMPLEDVRAQYIQPYITSFPNSIILMRRPFNAAKEHGFGIFNDMTGAPEDTQEWLGWIESGGEYNETDEENALAAMQDAWKTAPIGGEFTSGITMGQLLDAGLNTTLNLLEQSHTTFIGPMIPKDNTYANGIAAVLKRLGYRLRIDSAKLKTTLFSKGLSVELKWANDGIAPIYKPWSVYIYLFDQTGKEVLKVPVDIDITKIINTQSVTSTTMLPTYYLPDGIYDLAIAVIDPMAGKPAVAFAMENTRSDRIYVLGKWEKGNNSEEK